MIDMVFTRYDGIPLVIERESGKFFLKDVSTGMYIDLGSREDIQDLLECAEKKKEFICQMKKSDQKILRIIHSGLWFLEGNANRMMGNSLFSFDNARIPIGQETDISAFLSLLRKVSKIPESTWAMQKYCTLSLLLEDTLEIQVRLDNLDKLLNQGEVGPAAYENMKEEYLAAVKEFQEDLELEKNRFMEDYVELVGRMRIIEQSLEELEAKYAIHDIDIEKYEKHKSSLKKELAETSPLYEGMMSLIDKLEKLKSIEEKPKKEEITTGLKSDETEIGMKTKNNSVIFKKKTEYGLKTEFLKDNTNGAMRTKDT